MPKQDTNCEKCKVYIKLFRYNSIFSMIVLSKNNADMTNESCKYKRNGNAQRKRPK